MKAGAIAPAFLCSDQLDYSGTSFSVYYFSRHFFEKIRAHGKEILLWKIFKVLRQPHHGLRSAPLHRHPPPQDGSERFLQKSCENLNATVQRTIVQRSRRSAWLTEPFNR